MNLKKTIKVLIFIVVFSLLIYKIGQIPNGLFCDEAQIGVSAYNVIQGNFSEFINPFFYRHLSTYLLGTLPIIATVPFTAILGLSEYSTRLASITFGYFSLIVIYLILKKLNQRLKILTVIFVAFTPIFYHISRNNFGHSIAILFIFLGYLTYIIASQNKSRKLFFISGLLFAIAAYGYGSFVLTVLLFIASIIISEIVFNGIDRRKYLNICILIVALIIGYLPIFHQILVNPDQYFVRIKEKSNHTSFALVDQVKKISLNYPKYYNPEYLFIKGEIDMPGAFITRHSIRGNGEYFLITMLLLPLSFWMLFKKKDKQKKYVLPAFIFFFLFPIPDALTSALTAPPYSLAVYSSMLSLPFMVNYGFQFFTVNLDSKKNLLQKSLKFALIITVIIIMFEIVNFMKNYQKYPLYSSDYWGWQWGFGRIIEYYKTVNNQYDDLYIAPLANAPHIFFDFYDPNKECINCSLGNHVNYDANRKQLFADGPESLNEYKKLGNIRLFKTLYYPNGQVAFYIIDPE